ncbi:Mu transposase C-terminal domain-containing protein [Undibacterium arcticum]
MKGGTPYAAWKVAQPLSRPVKHMDDLYAAFLPAVLRTLHRGGIVFNHIRYWNPLLTPLLATPTKLIVHYDPADISALHVKLPDGSYLKVGYADLRHPAIALWECLATLKYLRTVSRLAINETRLFEAINAQRKIIDDAKKTRLAPHVKGRREKALKRARAPSTQPRITHRKTNHRQGSTTALTRRNIRWRCGSAK